MSDEFYSFTEKKPTLASIREGRSLVVWRRFDLSASLLSSRRMHDVLRHRLVGGFQAFT